MIYVLPARLRCRLALSRVLLTNRGNDVKLDGGFRGNQGIQGEHRESRRRLRANRADAACSACTPFTEVERRMCYWWMSKHWTGTCIEHCKHKPAGSHALVSLLEGRRWCHGFESRLVDSGCDLLPIRSVYCQHHPGDKEMLDKQSLLASSFASLCIHFLTLTS